MIEQPISSTVTYTITPTANGCTGENISTTVTVFSDNYNLFTTVTNSTPSLSLCSGDEFFIEFEGANPSSNQPSVFFGGVTRWETRFTWSISNPNVNFNLVEEDMILSSGISTNDGDDGRLALDLINNTGEDQQVTITVTPWAWTDDGFCFIVCNYNNNWTQSCSGSSVSTTITVHPFQAACPTDYEVNNDPGNCSASVTTDNPAFDCSPVEVTWNLTGATTASSPSAGINYVGTRTFNVGTTTVTYSAEDNSGNISTCSYTVTVNDIESPVISNCPTDITVSMDLGQCSANVTFTDPTVTDNCDGTVTPVRTDGTGLNSGDEFTVGTTTISYIATDDAGNTATCSFNITVLPDSEAPVISCTGNQSGCAVTGSTFTKTGIDWDASATENCGTASISYVLSNATTGTGTSLNNVEFNVGTTTVTWTAVDLNGYSSSCQFDVVVTEGPAITTDPVSQAVCLNGSVTFTATASGTPVPTYQWRKNGTDIPGETGSTLTISPVLAGDAANYDVVVTNACGTATSAPATLSVTSPPVITSQPANQTDCFGGDVLFTVAASGGQSPYTYSWEMMRPSESWIPALGEPGVSLPVDGQMLVENIGDASNPNATRYRVTVTDNCGNSSSISSEATLTVNEMIIQPLVTETVCQGGFTTFTVSTSGTTPVLYEWQLNGSTISNGGPFSGATTQTLTVTNSQLSENGTYSARAIFSITQPNNNGAGVTTCPGSFIDVGELTVDEGPAILANPDDQTKCSGVPIDDVILSNANGTPGTTYSWTRDNTVVLSGIPASGTTSTISGILTSIDQLVFQTTTFQITAEANGCVSTGTFTINVVDNVPEVEFCPDDFTVGADAGICGAVVTYTEPTFFDACDGSGLIGTRTEGLASGSEFPVGTTTITYEYTDLAEAGTAVCTFEITVEDDVLPVANCQDITVQLDATGTATITQDDIDDGSTDNCDIPSLTIDKTTFDCTDVGP